MTYQPTIYDWRPNVIPSSQVFRAGGQSGQGGLTLGGFTASNPEPGGRAELRMGFNVMPSIEASRDASWLMSRLMNGAVMRVPLYRSPQLVALDPSVYDGIPFSTGQSFSDGRNWKVSPVAAVVVGGLSGETKVSIDLSGQDLELSIGQVVGFRVGADEFSHMVMDIDDRDLSSVTLTLEPPLRRDITTDNHCKFRPSMTAICSNPEQVLADFDVAGFVQPGRVQFVEVLV